MIEGHYTRLKYTIKTTLKTCKIDIKKWEQIDQDHTNGTGVISALAPRSTR